MAPAFFLAQMMVGFAYANRAFQVPGNFPADKRVKARSRKRQGKHVFFHQKPPVAGVLPAFGTDDSILYYRALGRLVTRVKKPAQLKTPRNLPALHTFDVSPHASQSPGAGNFCKQPFQPFALLRDSEFPSCAYHRTFCNERVYECLCCFRVCKPCFSYPYNECYWLFWVVSARNVNQGYFLYFCGRGLVLMAVLDTFGRFLRVSLAIIKAL